MREAWLMEVVRECQVMAGDALHTRDRALADVIAGFSGRIPEPQSQVEAAMLRGMLIDLCLRWGDANHRAYHEAHERHGTCRFVPSEIASRAWRDRAQPPKAALQSWGAAYCDGFEAAHPLHRAIELRDYIDAHFDERCSAAAMAVRSGITARRLQHEFVKLTGMTVRAYQTKRRVDVAIEMLRRSDDKVFAVAQAVGWSSRKDLNRALRRYAGATPAAIRDAMA